MNSFKEYVENPLKLVMIFLIECCMSWYIYRFKNSQEIISIKQERSGALIKAFEIVHYGQ